MTHRVALSSFAEKRAERAEGLPAFSGVKLLQIKREIATILGLIGRDGIFDQYTLHDIEHVDVMLANIEWLVPLDSRSLMTPADWLLLVLAVYFHDVGMLVTPDEFDYRSESSFPRYRDELFGGPHGLDYRSKVQALGPGDSDRFLYQEFVRQHHAERARAWIAGSAPDHLGITHNTMEAVCELLNSLDRQFRKDLGLVCASHHLDDLADLEKYRVRRSYGQSPDEVCNLQFCAILLRAADLLHITQDRTPSVAFKLINPTDPVSQEEWAKQRAVRRVCPRPAIPSDSATRETSTSDTIEVHAFFTDSRGFFGLTSYVRYAQSELNKCHHWAELARKQAGVSHTFPWRFIDDTNIEAENFIPRAFSFRLDQTKVLELLVGHTLYNNTDAVIRELLQNSLDAVRLQRLVETQNASTPTRGEIRVFWDSITRALIVEDNGTGMSQDVIEQHLLNVGASLYQEERFKKEFPTFTPISRFGIGILSTFMVSDEVEILTCHDADDHARELSLRSVHGRYLVRLVEKASAEAKGIAPHGTRVIVKLRPSAALDDVLQSTQKWVVLPGDGIHVTVTIDQGPPVEIGYKSLTEALGNVRNVHRAFDAFGGRLPLLASDRIEIREKTAEAVSIAYAVSWSEKQAQWSFVGTHGPGEAFGTCLEGIRVEHGTPGFQDKSICAIANVHGLDAPKTTVSRDGFERTTELEQMLRTVFRTYAAHVMEEFDQLQKRRPYSVTWAAREAKDIASSLVHEYGHGRDSFRGSIFDEVFDEVPLLLAEANGSRRCVSVADLNREERIWTIECGLCRWAEELLREIPTSLSLSAVAKTLTKNTFIFPSECLLSVNTKLGYWERRALRTREVDKIVVDKGNRRVDLRWTKEACDNRWLRWIEDDELDFKCQHVTGQHRDAECYVPLCDVQISGLSAEVAVRGNELLILNPESPMVKYIIQKASEYRKAQTEKRKEIVIRACKVLRACLRTGGNYFEKVLSDQGKLLGEERLKISEWPQEELRAICAAAELTHWQIYNPLDWMRGMKI